MTCDATSGRETIVVAGALAQRPHAGGHAWVFLQYLLGFRRLGFDAFFVDWLDPAMCDGPLVSSPQARYLAGVMKRFGFDDAFALLDRFSGESVSGRDRATAVAAARRSVFLLNVMGYLEDEELRTAAPRRVFLDIDPGFPQLWYELGIADVFTGHEVFVTVGANVGLADCTVPTCGRGWIPTRPPVVLDHWPVADEPWRPITSVASWRGAFAPIEYEGKMFGLRVHEFRKFFELPQRTGRPFELALDIHSAETRDLNALSAHGWTLLDPVEVAGEPEAFRQFVADSTAEFMVAKALYVDTRGGWFSDRSACYLASGRPVLAQDTGLDDYPRGLGLLAFSTVDEAAAGVEAIVADYDRHAAAARELATEYFDSDRVLSGLVDAVTSS